MIDGLFQELDIILFDINRGLIGLCKNPIGFLLDILDIIFVDIPHIILINGIIMDSIMLIIILMIDFMIENG